MLGEYTEGDLLPIWTCSFLLNVEHLPLHTLRYGNSIRDFFGLYYFNVTVPVSVLPEQIWKLYSQPGLSYEF